MRAAVVVVVLLASCAGILGLRRDSPNMFPHRRHVVAGVACTRCHTDVFSRPDKLHLPSDASCVSCHAKGSPDHMSSSEAQQPGADRERARSDRPSRTCRYGDRGSEDESRELPGMRSRSRSTYDPASPKPHDPRPCSNCHAAPGTAANLSELRRHLKFDHGRHAKPTSGNCMRCHDAVGQNAATMRPAMATCFRCHDKDAERDGRRCDVCHTDLAESGTLPASHLAHDGDWLREHGARAASSGDLCETCHRQSFCASCHGQTAPALPATRRFADPMTPTIHRAGFATRHALEAKSDPGACTTCHAPDRCAGCHQARNVAGDSARNPHPAGWVGLTAADNLHGREARRDPTSCAGCHGGAGESLCVSCHRVGGVGGNPHPPGWSSQLPMSAMPCKLCHPVGAR